MMWCLGCSLLTTTSISLAIFFNQKVMIFLRQDGLRKDERLAFRGIQKTMIIQLISHCMMLSLPFAGLVIFTILEIPHLLPFTAMMECGPTVTTTLTLISVPEYRKKVKIFFKRTVKPLIIACLN